MTTSVLSRVAALLLVPLILGGHACHFSPLSPVACRLQPVLVAAQAGIDTDVAAILKGIKSRDRGQLAVSEEDGRLLRVIAATSGAQRALEIGAGSGYSTIWIGLGLRQSGGKLIAIEYDPTRAREAALNVQRAGLSDIVRVIGGDAFAEIPKLGGTFDFVFLDAWKPDYKRFFDLTFPRIAPGGVLLAHNVINKGSEMKDFLSAVAAHPGAWSTVVAPSSEGMSITYKKR